MKDIEIVCLKIEIVYIVWEKDKFVFYYGFGV